MFRGKRGVAGERESSTVRGGRRSRGRIRLGAPERLEDRIVLTPGGPDLGMFLSAGTASLAAGGSETYTLQVANNATADAILLGTPITVTDTVPMGFSNVSASASSGWSFTNTSTTSPSTITATYTGSYPIPGGQFLPSITLTGTATGTPTGSISNTASVSVVGDSNPADNTATTNVTVTAPVPNPDVSTSLAVVGGPTFTSGDTVTFYDTIINTGALILISESGVQATITIPAGMTNVSATGTNWLITTSSATSPSTVTATYTGGPILPAIAFPVITLTGTLGPAATPSFTITAGVTDTAHSSDMSTTSSTIDVAASTTPSAVSVTAASGIYGGTASLSATLTSASLPVVGEPVVFHIGATYVGTATTIAGGIATLSNASLGSIDAGTYASDITATFAGDATYGSSNSAANLTVAPAPLVVTASGATKVYGQANPAFTGSVAGILNSDDVSVNYGTTASQFSDVQAGGYAIIQDGLSGAKALDYSLTVAGGSFTPGTLTITPAPLIVTGDSQTKVYGQANPTLTGSAVGIFNSDDVSAAYTTTATQYSDVQAGGYAITLTGLTGAKAIDYSTTVTGGVSVPGTMTVTPAPLVVVANSSSKVYGQAIPTLTGTITGILNGDDVTTTYLTPASQYSDVFFIGYPVVFSGLSGAKALDYSTTVSGGSFSPGTLTITPAPLVVSAISTSKVYGQANPTFTGTVTGILNSDDVTASYATTAAQFSDVQAGGYAITFGSLGGAKAFDYSTTVAGGSFTTATLAITPAPLIVVANVQGKVYGQANPTLTGTVSGLLNGDVVNPNYVTTAGQYSDVQSGGYAIFLDGISGAKAIDYSTTIVGGSYTPAALTITPAPVGVEGDAQSKVYGQANPALTGSVFGLLNGDVVGASYATTATQYSDVQAGGYATTLTGLTGAKAIDYSTTVIGGAFEPGLLTITPAPLSVAVSNLTKVYGQANPSFSSAVTGIVNGDDVAIDFTTTATQYSDVQAGGYPISFAGLSGTKAADYSFPGTINATLTVTPAPLTITVDNPSKVYGHTNPELIATIGGVLNGDDVSANLATAAAQYSDVQAGGYAIIVDGLNGSKAADYSTTVIGASVTDGTLTVTPAPLTVLVADQSRVYGQANPTATGVFSGALNGDDVQLAYGTTATQFSDVVAGGFPILPTSLSGAKAADYSFSVEGSSVAPGTLTVAPAPLAIVANDVGRSYGQANPTLTGTSAGILNGDDVSFVLSTTATPSSDVVAGGYPIAVTGLSGAKAGDYAIANPTAGTLTVTPAPLTIAAENQDKVYGQANAPFTASYDGFVLGQDAGVLSGTLGFDTTVTAASHVGTYSIVPSGLTSGNYAINYTDGSLSVSPATLTVTPVDATKPFGVALPALSATYSGFVNGDTTASLTIPVALSTTATAGSASGNYPITASGGSSPDYTIVHGQGTLTVSARTTGTGSDDPAESAFITSLYQNLLGRAPLGADLSAWLAQLDGGTSESDVTSLIYNSAEAASFRTAQGLPTDPNGAEQITLVTSLYQNILGRAPEAAGLDAWLAQLDTGTGASSVAAMIGASPEAIAARGSQSPPVVPGAATQATLVTSLYQNILGRAPEAAGLDAWLAQLDAGTGASSVAAMINNSPEAIADRATQSPSASPGQIAFVNALYEVLFGRDPEPLGLNGWTSLLVAGTTRADVAEGVYHSPEANALHNGSHHGPTISEPDALAYALNAQKKLGQV